MTYTKTLLALLLLAPAALHAQTLRFHTNVGDIDVNLLPGSAPKTVANFLNYVNQGKYNNSIIHRVVPGFVIQGGGYVLQSTTPVAIIANPAVPNEFSQSNITGTLAMALLSGDPNSATDEWFFNLVDNSATLDSQLFTVFGRIVDQNGLSVMNAIGGEKIFEASGSFGPAFTNLPLQNYNGGALIPDNFITVLSIEPLAPPPAISAGGIISASGFGGFPAAAVGSFVEIYGTNFAGTSRPWNSGDFTNGIAPTSLDGVTVTVNGVPAYVNYVSPGQVNIQVPANVPSGGQVPVIVTYGQQPSAPVLLAMKPIEPGLLAPSTFLVKGRQYVAAFHADATLVSGGNIPGVPSAPAKPNETIIFYGAGFGPLQPGSTAIAGQIPQGSTMLTVLPQFSFGPLPGTVSYYGLAPGLVGVYQFNVTVPTGAPNGDVPLTVSVGATNVSQTLYLAVHN